MNKKDLITAADELTKVLGGVKPPIVTNKGIDILKEQVKQAGELLNPGEEEELSEKTVSILEELGVWVNKESGEGVEENEPTALQEQVEDAEDLDELKLIVKNHDEFKALRKKVNRYKENQMEDLREDMLDLLVDNVEEPEEQEEPEVEVPTTEEVIDEVDFDFDGLREDIENAKTLKKLKAIITDNEDVFEELLEDLDSYEKDEENDLRDDMLLLLPEPVKEKTSKKVKAEKTKPVEKKVKEKPEKVKSERKKDSAFAVAMEILGENPRLSLDVLKKKMEKKGFNPDEGNGIRSAHITMKRVFTTLERYGHIK